MEKGDFQQACSKTLDFIQTFIDSVPLGLSVSAISEDEFEALVRDRRSTLNWRAYFPHYLSDDSFHLALKLNGADDIDGAILAVYSTSENELHIFLLESFIRQHQNHPLKGRLTALTIVAATWLLTLLNESKGAYIVNPDPQLIPHYARFGFAMTRETTNAMYATIEVLQAMQIQLMQSLRERNL